MINTDGMQIEEAIVAQAFEDYRTAIRGKGQNPERMYNDVMRFFKSKYYSLLTDMDYMYILRQLDKEWEDGQKLIEAGNQIECAELKKKYKFVCPLCKGRAETHEYKRKTKLGTSYYRSYSCKDCKTYESRLPIIKGATNEQREG